MANKFTLETLLVHTANPLLSPPPPPPPLPLGGLFISSLFEGGLNRDRGAYLREGATLI